MANRLNSIPTEVFKVNAENFGGDRERALLVASGRMLMADAAGRNSEALTPGGEKYERKMTSKEYQANNEGYMKRRVLFAAKLTDEMDRKTPPQDYEAFMRVAHLYMRNPNFVRILAGLDQEVVGPIWANTFATIMDYMVEPHEIGFGRTKELTIVGNTAPLYQDSSWGAMDSVPANRLYDDTVTLNPKQKTAKMNFKWYQLIGNDVDIGVFYNGLAAGGYSKATAMSVQKLVSASTNTDYIPSNLQFTFNTGNFMTAANRVSALNRVPITSLICVGGIVPIGRIVPDGVVNATAVNLDAALAGMLGVPYLNAGYLGNYMGVRILPLTDAIVPGTENTTVTTILPNNRIWMLAGLGGNYKPLAMGYFPEITLEYDPFNTPDLSMDIISNMYLDVKEVFASKIATTTI